MKPYVTSFDRSFLLCYGFGDYGGKNIKNYQKQEETSKISKTWKNIQKIKKNEKILKYRLGKGGWGKPQTRNPISPIWLQASHNGADRLLLLLLRILLRPTGLLFLF